MKSVAWIVVVAVIALGAGYFVRDYRTRNTEQAYKLELAALKRTFLTQSVGLRLLDEETYRREVGTALSDYFGKLDALRRKYPALYDLEREKKNTDAEFANGRLSEPQKQARVERIGLSQDMFARMRDGQYRPLYTGVDKTFRFDIQDIQATTIAGEKRLKLSYVHWGAFGQVQYSMIEGNIRAPQEKGKEVAIPKISATNQPPTLQVDPERWVSEFIPGTEIGYYDLPLFPNEATAVELVFDFTVQSPGGSPQLVHIAFPSIPIAPQWKLAPGEKWAAEEQIASPEELQAAGVGTR